MGTKQTKSTSSTYSLKHSNTANKGGSLKRTKTFNNNQDLLKQQQKRKSTSSLQSTFYNYGNTVVDDKHDDYEVDLKALNSNSCTTSATTTTASSSVSNKLNHQNRANNNNNNNNYQEEFNNNVNNNNKSAFKRFGISPRFKRKIVEAITKTTTNNNTTANNNVQAIQKRNVRIFLKFRFIFRLVVYKRKYL